MQVIVCRTLDEAQPHVSAWEELSRDAHAGRAHGEWFAGPLWLIPLLRTYFSDKTLALVFLYDGPKLNAVIPLAQGTTLGAPCPATYSLPVNTHVRRIGILSRIDQRVAVAEAMRQLFATGVRGVSTGCIALRQIERGSALATAVQATAMDDGLSLNVMEESRSAVVDVPHGWEAYLATRSREQLHPLRKRKRMDRAGGWQFSRVDDARPLDSAWEGLLHVERRSWKQEAGTSIDNEPGAATFYREVARANARVATLRLHLLELHGVPVAHTLGAVHGRTYYLLKHSFDEAHRQLSPGFQLLLHVMQESVAEGCTRLDLLGDTMSWKVAVATSQPEYASYMLFPRSNVRCQLCRLTNQTLKPIARALGVKRLANLVRGRTP